MGVVAPGCENRPRPCPHSWGPGAAFKSLGRRLSLGLLSQGVDDSAIQAIAQELLSEHGAVVGEDELWRALILLPDVSEWAIAQAAPLVFALATEDTLFTVGVEEGRVSAQSRPLARHRLTVNMASGAGRQTEAQIVVRETIWTFGYLREAAVSPEPWRTIVGRVETNQRGQQRLDQREMLARAIASRAGWARFGG